MARKKGADGFEDELTNELDPDPPKPSKLDADYKASRYLVRTRKNPTFSGRTCGVKFDNGKAVVDRFSIRADLGWTVAMVVRTMVSDFGYTAEPVED